MLMMRLLMVGVKGKVLSEAASTAATLTSRAVKDLGGKMPSCIFEKVGVI